LAQAAEGRPWRGPTRPYDLVKEFTIATVVVTLLVVGLAVLLGSPDEKAVTLQGWAKAAPADFAGLAQAQHLSGSQWGMMNETGSFPGQAWLWLYTFWYQISPFNHSGNGDALVWAVMAVLVLAFIFVPFLPGLRSMPHRLGVHRLIWRDWYSRAR